MTDSELIAERLSWTDQDTVLTWWIEGVVRPWKYLERDITNWYDQQPADRLLMQGAFRVEVTSPFIWKGRVIRTAHDFWNYVAPTHGAIRLD